MNKYIVTNNLNKRSVKNSSSKYLGVRLKTSKYKEKTYKYWVAYIGINNKEIYLGRFESEIEAAKARDKASIKYYGEFAGLNFKQSKTK